MSYRKKFRTAARILRERGLSGLIRATLDDVRASSRPRPDEARIIYDAMHACGTHGTMIDVGAHFGSSLKPFAEGGWRVYCFEPDSRNREVLDRNFGTVANVAIDPRAVSDKDGTSMMLYRSNLSTGISGLSAFHASHEEGEEVAVTTLRDVMAEQDIPAADVGFLKIDTEGFDLFVLKGFPWESGRPLAILCEFEDRKTLPLGYTFNDLATFLQEKGYELLVSEWLPVKSYGSRHDWRRCTSYPCTLLDANAWGNIIAIRADEPALLAAVNREFSAIQP